MLQRDCLLEWRNILSNTMFGLEVKGKKVNVNKEYVLELLKNIIYTNLKINIHQNYREE